MESKHLDGPIPPAMATALLRMIVRVALADGKYVPKEAALIDEFARRFGVEARLAESIIQDERERPSTAATLAAAITTDSLRSQIVEACMTLAGADDEVHPAETAFIRELCDAWGMKVEPRVQRQPTS